MTQIFELSSLFSSLLHNNKRFLVGNRVDCRFLTGREMIGHDFLGKGTGFQVGSKEEILLRPNHPWSGPCRGSTTPCSSGKLRSIIRLL